MKKLVVMIFVVLLTGGCEAQGLTVSDLDDLGPVEEKLTAHFNSIDLFKNIGGKTGYLITEDEELGKKFIQGEGVDQEDNHVVFRAECTVHTQGDQYTVVIATTGESCTGHNCAKCKFASGGGCDCKKVGSVWGESSYCDHAITK